MLIIPARDWRRRAVRETPRRSHELQQAGQENSGLKKHFQTYQLGTQRSVRNSFRNRHRMIWTLLIPNGTTTKLKAVNGRFHSKDKEGDCTTVCRWFWGAWRRKKTVTAADREEDRQIKGPSEILFYEIKLQHCNWTLPKQSRVQNGLACFMFKPHAVFCLLIGCWPRQSTSSVFLSRIWKLKPESKKTAFLQ